MTTLRTAAQQTLKALGKWSIGYHVDAVQLNDLIAKLEAALEQPEQPEQCACGDRPKENCPGEWEPGCDLGNNPKYARRVEWTPSHITDRQFYPPRREWRGLTDTERAAVQFESFKRGLSPLEFMELHEAKLKERNA
jgi:hypothetical protein